MGILGKQLYEQIFVACMEVQRLNTLKHRMLNTVTCSLLMSKKLVTIECTYHKVIGVPICHTQAEEIMDIMIPK